MSRSLVPRRKRTSAWVVTLATLLGVVESAPGQSPSNPTAAPASIPKSFNVPPVGGIPFGSNRLGGGRGTPGTNPNPNPPPGCPVPPICPPFPCPPVIGYPIIVAPYPYLAPYPYGVGPAPAIGPPALGPEAVAGMEADPDRLDLEVRRARAAAEPARPSRKDRDRASERVLVGDRLFRAGELVKAAQRYSQAIQADPDDAKPYSRLAQVAFARGRYSEAADRLREAQAAQPGWMILADDVQGLFGEPAEFAAEVNKLESHLQANPDDRDAWLVLGAELYLSGRTRRAADVFLRLTDRQPDATLAAFLRASRAGEDRP